METRGIRNNNPLNIRKGNNWQGERHPQSDTAFEEFSCMVYGLRAGFKLIKNYMTKAPRATTIRDIITRWAPPSENDTEGYIRFVATSVGIRPETKIDFRECTRICALVSAMCQMESNYKPSQAILATAYGMVV